MTDRALLELDDEDIDDDICWSCDGKCDRPECRRDWEDAMSELKQRAFDLYKPPFRSEQGYIKDANNLTVVDQNDYLSEPEALQGQVGEMIAEALTEYWNRRAETGRAL